MPLRKWKEIQKLSRTRFIIPDRITDKKRVACKSCPFFLYLHQITIKINPMTLEEKKMEFVVFCIENVAEQLNELPENIYSRLNNLGLIDDLLFDCYEVLHTQSKQHITEDIILALKNREKGEISQ